jgi:raffinose/stachyose/melibiose transport system permease protein
MIIVVPFFVGVFYSLTDWNATARSGQGLQFIGLQNFINSFADPSFVYSFLITTLYTLLSVIAINVVAILVALAVTSKLRLRNAYRMGFFLPYLIGGLVLGYLWQFVFNNAIPALLMDPAKLMLGQVSTSLIALVIVGTWQYAGYIMMIYVAAIEGIPTELYEAARMDGAPAWQQFRAITMPMIAQAFTITMFLTLVNSFKQFDVNFSLTGGGPATVFMDKSIFGTELLAMNIYNTAFIGNNLAAGQARAVIFFVVIVIFSLIQVNYNKRRELEL